MNLYNYTKMDVFLFIKKWVYALSLFLIMTACQNHSKSAGDATVIVEKTDFKKTYKASNLFEKVEIIPLETNDSCLIGDCSKITLIKDTIYILDKKSNQMFCFDRRGKYVRKIGRVGRAGDEYLEVDDFCILKNGNIAIVDRSLRKLIIYDCQNKALVVQKLPFIADALEELNDSVMVFNCYDTPVVVWNYRQRKIVNSFLKYDKKFCGRPLKPFTKFKEEVLWHREYHQELFRVGENELTTGRKVDFGEHNSTGEFVVGFMGLYFLPPDVAEMWYYTETPDYITFHFSCDVINENPFFAFHSKKRKRNIILNHDYFTDDLTYYISPPQIVTDAPDGGLVAALRTPIWFNHLEKLETSKQYEPESFNALKERLKGVQFSDNPVVAIYRLKPF